MKLKNWLTAAFENFIVKRLIKGVDAWEKSVIDRAGSLRGGKNSPIRFHIPRESLKMQGNHPLMPGLAGSTLQMIGSAINIRKSVMALDQNPSNGKKQIDSETLGALRRYAKSSGADEIGFSSVPREWVFQDTAIRYTEAVVLVMEMDKERIEKAPHRDTAAMVLDTYNTLGIISNRIADWLREHGYAAHAGHPLGGMALYPPMAQAAGLGWRGMNGLLITPQFGPRVRLAAVFTEIENLPISEGGEHAWVLDFCNSCKRCMRNCPPGAFYKSPIRHENGLVTVLDNRKCFPYFAAYHGCSICIKVCPFNQHGYEKVKEGFFAASPYTQPQTAGMPD